MSNIAEVAIYLAVLAIGWVGYVVLQVLRGRKKQSALGTAEAYEGNLVLPVAVSRRRGVFSRHHGVEYHTGSGGHAGAHHGPGGFDGHGAFGGGDGHR